jgi:hypothetical protein
MSLRLPAAILAILLVAIGIALLVRSLASEESVDEAVVTLSTDQTLYLNGMPVTATTHSPAEITVGFYTWYLTGLGLNPRFDATDEFATYVNLWLTPSFAAQWKKIAADTNANAFLLAQDFSPTWGRQVTTAVESKSANRSDVLITLGTAPNTHRLRVTLLKTSQGWRIESVASVF